MLTGLGALSSNGSNAVAYLWDVDQGEAGYTTWEKAGHTPPAECSKKVKYDNIGDFLLAEIEAGNVELADKGDLTPMEFGSE